MFARDAEFNDDFVGDGNCCKIELFDVGSEIPDLIDQVVGDISFILQV